VAHFGPVPFRLIFYAIGQIAHYGVHSCEYLFQKHAEFLHLFLLYFAQKQSLAVTNFRLG